jgi:hypothetical protein
MANQNKLTPAETQELKDDIIIAYNAIMSNLYKRWNIIDQATLRLYFLGRITNHILCKTKKELDKKLVRKSKINNIIKSIEEISGD